MFRQLLALTSLIWFFIVTSAAFCQPAAPVKTEVQFQNAAPGQVIQKKVHVVQNGELSINIVKRYGIDLPKLAAMNPGRKLNKLQVGDMLVVGVVKTPAPAKPSAAPASTKPKAAAKSAPTNKRPDKIAMMVEHEKSDAQQARKDEPSEAGMAFNVIWKLAFVIVIAYISMLMLKLMSNKKDNLPGMKRDLKVVDTVKLSSTSSVHLINVKGKTYLLGCSPGQVNLITEVEQESAPVAEVNTENKFADYLARYSGPKNQGTPSSRVAGLLKDCATHLQSQRNGFTKAGAGLLRGCATYIENRKQSDTKEDNNEA